MLVQRPVMPIMPNELAIGSEEDSLQNVLHLVPKPPTHTYNHFMDNWNKVLRFNAGMVAFGRHHLLTPHDKDRRCGGGAVDGLSQGWMVVCGGVGAEGGLLLVDLSRIRGEWILILGVESWSTVRGLAGEILEHCAGAGVHGVRIPPPPWPTCTNWLHLNSLQPNDTASSCPSAPSPTT